MAKEFLRLLYTDTIEVIYKFFPGFVFKECTQVAAVHVKQAGKKFLCQIFLIVSLHMKAREMFKEYRKMKQEILVLEFQLQNFDGVSDTDVIESMNYARPQGERVQTGETADKTGKTAIYYRRVKSRMDDDWYDSLFERYEYLNEEVTFFEFAVTQLSGRLQEFVRELIMERMSWDELSIKYHISRSMIGKYRKKAEKELDAMYEFRDKMEAEYFLS